MTDTNHEVSIAECLVKTAEAIHLSDLLLARCGNGLAEAEEICARSMQLISESREVLEVIDARTRRS
jgi:hypothetical protein